MYETSYAWLPHFMAVPVILLIKVPTPSLGDDLWKALIKDTGALRAPLFGTLIPIYRS